MGKSYFQQGLILWISGVLVLAVGVTQGAAVDIEFLELDERRHAVDIAILGGPGFDTRNIQKDGLVLGWYGQAGDGGFVSARIFSRRQSDLNGDGHRDRVAKFLLNETDFESLRNGKVVQVQVEGMYHDGVFTRAFISRSFVSDSDGTPSSTCASVTDEAGTKIGQRCIWTSADGSAFKPIIVETLVGDLNNSLASDNLEIAQDSAAVIEAYGGRGQNGEKKETSCNAKAGSGGVPGYAQTILDVTNLPSNLWIYPSEPGDTMDYREGGSGTVVSSSNLADLTDNQLGSTTVEDIVAAGILAIGGGSGGGGNGNTSADGGNCHHGGDGGMGGSAMADTSNNVAGAGSDGSRGDPGDGGSCTAAGGGGGMSGSTGIGGPGGQSTTSEGGGSGGGTLWNGWSSSDNQVYTPTNWVFGAGGYNDHNGGRGGGGCGGGGSAKGTGDGHKGGGGGGGSLAMQATVDASTIDADLIYGSPTTTNDFSSQVVVTFELKPK